MAGLLIGEVAQRAGITASAVRYYEELGLLPAPARVSAGYRRYSQETVEQLQFIRKAQALGFSLHEIDERDPDPPRRMTYRTAQTHQKTQKM